MITQETLKEVLKYDPETGLFTRLKGGSGRNNFIGATAGYLDKSKGYISIKINNKGYYAHRLAILYVTGKLPQDQVDHIDGIKTNNKWLNLRECNNSQNLQNQRRAMSNNKSTGLLGVSPSRTNNKTFDARIGINYKQIHLGTFKTPEEAHQVYLKAKRELHEFGTL